MVCIPIAQAQPAAPHQDGEPAVIGGMESTPKSKARLAERRKALAKIKLVDINSATEVQLKKLPGIGDAEAKRIVANRPYGSKVWLVTNGVIGEGPYTNIKHLIVAKQPFKTAEENVALYDKLKKEKAVKP
ncbi:helix-hairpin-helix domain-containing protein [Rhodoferax sp. GW822-FHT02A01]|uniref:ComEA family DNA-binding protein n=1 Tax=Rhodoferax sp. GW822-FHT02A01 TaxID=3141537 RepID=UPI00315DDF56